MKNKRIVTLVYNELPLSKETADYVRNRLNMYEFKINETISTEADLIICIGGDGSFFKSSSYFPIPTNSHRWNKYRPFGFFS